MRAKTKTKTCGDKKTMKKDALITELIDVSNTVLKFPDHKAHADTNDCEFCNMSGRVFSIVTGIPKI